MSTSITLLLTASMILISEHMPSDLFERCNIHLKILHTGTLIDRLSKARPSDSPRGAAIL